MRGKDVGRLVVCNYEINAFVRLCLLCMIHFLGGGGGVEYKGYH